MRIACLAWGSLVWDPRSLPIQREWFRDGPFLSVEFTRKSSDGRVTLVIDDKAAPVRVLWATMLPDDLQTARAALRDRECITAADWESRIGVWESDQQAPASCASLPAWARSRGIDAAIWTALGPKFDRETSPSADDVVRYLASLEGTRREHAERYIRHAPRQIDTLYRRRIEAVLGWTFQPVAAL
jgi:hypothetical protein